MIDPAASLDEANALIEWLRIRCSLLNREVRLRDEKIAELEQEDDRG